jgi:hypothetical protein
MVLSAPHQRFRDALEAADWQIMRDIPLSGNDRAVNPSRLRVRRGRLQRQILAYAWKIQDEGKGRVKAGRADLDWRVETTRSHDGDLLAPPGHLSVGLGWSADRELFAGFDPWIKRTTGKTSSVHFTDVLLKVGATHGWAEEMRPDGPTCSFRPELIDRFLSWALACSHDTLLMAVNPVEYSLDDQDAARLRLDPRKSWRYFDLRQGDCLVLSHDGQLLSNVVWRIEEIETDRQKSAGGSNRPYLVLRCHRHGIVRDEAWIGELSA